MLEMNPDKLAACIGAAEQAIAQRESLVDTTELERRKLADARSMLKRLSRIASSQGKQAAYDALQPGQHERLGKGFFVQTPSRQARARISLATGLQSRCAWKTRSRKQQEKLF